jgi:hypothetical protein
MAELLTLEASDSLLQCRQVRTWRSKATSQLLLGDVAAGLLVGHKDVDGFLLRDWRRLRCRLADESLDLRIVVTDRRRRTCWTRSVQVIILGNIDVVPAGGQVRGEGRPQS